MASREVQGGTTSRKSDDLEGWTPRWRSLSNALGLEEIARPPAWALLAFFCLVMFPIWFICTIYSCAFVLVQLSGWKYERSVRFMASAYTGGSIAMSHDAPVRTVTKIFVSYLGASGVGVFGFMVALLLGSGVVQPILVLTGLGHGARRVWLGFLSVTGMAILSMSLFAALGAGVMYLVVGWPWFTAFQTIASVELGGGIFTQNWDDNKMNSPGYGNFIFITIGCWAIVFAALMISVAGTAFGNHIQNMSKRIDCDSTVDMMENLKRFARLVLLLLPLIMVLGMLLVAGCMHILAGWDFELAFWLALPAVTGGAAVLAPGPAPEHTAVSTVLAFLYTATLGFFSITIVMGIGSQLISMVMCEAWEQAKLRSGGRAVPALLTLWFVLLPSAVYASAVPMGGLLAWVEGWPFADGFWWTVAVQCGGGMALTSKSPDDNFGRWLALAFVAWSIGISIISVGLNGAPAIELESACGIDVSAFRKELLTEASPLIEESEKTRSTLDRTETLLNEIEEGTAELIAEEEKKLFSRQTTENEPTTAA